MNPATRLSPIRQLITEHRRQMARIHRRGYRTITETHAIGPLRLSFTRIDNPDDVLDRVVEEEDRRERLTGQRRDGNELHLPYWAELWDSAMGISRWIVERRDDLKFSDPSKHKTPTSVLDLGCGMGFTGMVAAALGARVVLADLEAEALLFARLNTLRWRRSVQTRRLNWQTDRLAERFDLIIGADVLYDRTQWGYLEPFFRAHLAPGGKILLGEPGRQTGDLFPDWIAARGWHLSHAQQHVPTRERPIRLFVLEE